MKILIRMSKQLETEVRADLARRHAFAVERIGFLFSKTLQLADDELLILMARYFPVHDDEYIEDDEVGAKIGSTAIRRGMQEAMDSGEGAFHVHAHDFSSKPEFSAVDRRSAALLMPSFQTVSPHAAHGAFLFGSEGCVADVWLPNQKKAQRAARVSIAGHPLRIYGGKNGWTAI